MRPAGTALLTTLIGFFLFLLDLLCLFQVWLLLSLARSITGWGAFAAIIGAFIFAWLAAFSLSIGGMIAADGGTRPLTRL